MTSLRTRLRSAGGAVAVPFVTAAGSLILQMMAARTLGGAGYGSYALFTGTLILIIAVHSSWVGDALTVFNRFDPALRGAVLLSMPVTIALGIVVGVVVAATTGGAGLGTVGLYALLVLLTLLSETTRRIFMARMEFWGLVANDCVNFGVTLMLAAGLVLQGHQASVGLLLAAMCAGQVTGILLALLRLPAREFRWAPLRGAAVRQVFGFGFWRSIHAGLRPASTLVSRLMIVGFASTTVLGGIEAARLLLSPAVTVVVGSGGYLLGYFSHAERAGRTAGSRQALRVAVLLGGVTLVLSAVGIVFAGPLEPVITGGDFEVDRIALFGWGVWAVSFALTMPLASLGTSRKLSRMVSAIRGVESVLGLGVLAVLLVIDPGLAAYAPFCLGAGGLVSSAVLWYLLRRTDRVPAKAPALPEPPKAAAARIRAEGPGPVPAVASAGGLTKDEVEVVVAGLDPAEGERADQPH